MRPGPRPCEEPADKTLRPALYTDLNVGNAVPSQPTGWEQASGATVTFTVPYNWTAGRIWGRTECNFSTNPGPNSCATGGCNGGFLCDASTGTARRDIDLELSVWLMTVFPRVSLQSLWQSGPSVWVENLTSMTCRWWMEVTFQ